MQSTNSRVKLYGADWCAMTTRAQRYLDELGVEYEYIDVEQDPAASEWVKQQNGGKERKPTFDIEGQVLCVPYQDEVERVLRDKGIL